MRPAVTDSQGQIEFQARLMQKGAEICLNAAEGRSPGWPESDSERGGPRYEACCCDGLRVEGTDAVFFCRFCKNLQNVVWSVNLRFCLCDSLDERCDFATWIGNAGLKRIWNAAIINL